MSLPAYAGPLERTWYYVYRVICGCIFFFLIAPIVVIVPLSFNAEPYFTFTKAMLHLDPAGFSLRWYHAFLTGPQWLLGIKNSFIIATFSTILATSLGTLAALGLSKSYIPGRNALMALLISPMVVPLIISGAGMYFFYSSIGLVATYPGIILAHTCLGTPFVIITVTATMVGFDQTLTRASATCGADPTTTFFKVTMPLIAPGVISGALFAFVTSLDEIVIVYFIAGPNQKTVPLKMFSGLREQISPTILAVATVLVGISIVLLTSLELIRRRNERLRGIVPQ